MKRYLRNTIIFVLIASVITVAVNLVYIKRNGSDDDYIKKFSSIPSNIEYCNFGSSHGLYGYNYVDYEDEANCFNFALSSQTLSYDKRVFEQYKDSIGKDAVVFINVSYFSLFGHPESEQDSFDSKNRRYYKFLPAKLIKEYDIKTDVYVNYFPSLIAGGSLLAKTLLVGSEDTNEDTWNRKANDPDVDVAADGEAACLRHIIKNKLDEEGNRFVNEEEYNALINLIEDCRNIDAIPVLITTPFLQEYIDQIKTDKTFYNDFYTTVDSVVEKTGVQYFDYGLDERFIDQYELFMNSDHLNEEGARVFVDILMDEVVPELKHK